MFENIRVSLYGTRAEVDNKSKSKSKKSRAKAPTAKKYVAISSSDIKNAKAFHVFYRKSSRSKWIRLTDELEAFPSVVRSIRDKSDFIEMFSSYLIETYFPKKAAPKKALPIEKPEKGVKIQAPEVPEKVKLELPKLPAEPRVVSTRRQVIPKLALIIYDELAGRGISWPEKRIDNMLRKLWRGFSKHPHLLTSDEFRRNIVTQEIIEQSKKERKGKAASLQDKFRKDLAEMEISLDPKIVGGEVRVQLKEVFNKMDMRSDDDQTRPVFNEKFQRVEVDRQILFVHVITEYDEFIQVNADDIQSNQVMFKEAINKVRGDVTKLFSDAIEKGVFSLGVGEKYSIRLLTPMIDTQGDVPRTYLDRNGNQTSGHGFGTARREVKDFDDLDELIDDMFGDLPRILARYVSLNSALGIGFTGFVIERLLE